MLPCLHMISSFVRSSFFVVLSLTLLGAGCGPLTTTIGTLPSSGTWAFNLEGGGDYLSGSACPSTTGIIASSGEADLAVSDSGLSATMNIDGQQLVFFQQPGSLLLYQTGSRMFPVQTSGTQGQLPYGTVFFDFVANTEDTIVGTIHWNNNRGCVGEYPFTMELLELELPGDVTTSPYTPSEGAWNLDLNHVTNNCDSSIASFPELGNNLDLSYVANLDTGETDGSEILFQGDSGNPSFFMERIGNSNVYAQSTEPVDIGVPVNNEGDLLLDYEADPFTAVMELTANGSNMLNGTIYMTSGSCALSASITLTR